MPLLAAHRSLIQSFENLCDYNHLFVVEENIHKNYKYLYLISAGSDHKLSDQMHDQHSQSS